MRPSLNNRAVIAAAGSRKTQFIIDEALAAPPGSASSSPPTRGRTATRSHGGFTGPTAASRRTSRSSAGSASS